MRRVILAAAICAVPMLAMAQNQTQVIGRDTPHDPADPKSPRTVRPAKPDQTTLHNTSKTLRTKDPFTPGRDQTPQQQEAPARAPILNR